MLQSQSESLLICSDHLQFITSKLQRADEDLSLVTCLKHLQIITSKLQTADEDLSLVICSEHHRQPARPDHPLQQCGIPSPR